MFRLLGYTAETEAENDDEIVDSFAAKIDTLSSFLEAGTPLVGDKLDVHMCDWQRTSTRRLGRTTNGLTNCGQTPGTRLKGTLAGGYQQTLLAKQQSHQIRHDWINSSTYSTTHQSYCWVLPRCTR